MTGDLPDMDEAVAFAVDDGAQAGPFPMREIVDSVRSGQRAANTLVWWAGEPDWVPFDSVPGLLAKIELESQPPPPSDDDSSSDDSPFGATETVESAGSFSDSFSDAASAGSDDAIGVAEDPFSGVADYSFGDSDDATTIADSSDAASDAGSNALDDASSEQSDAAETQAVDDMAGDLTETIGVEADPFAHDPFAEPVPSQVAEPDALLGDDPTATIAGGADEWRDQSDVGPAETTQDDATQTIGMDDVFETETPSEETTEFGSPVGELTDEYGGSGLFGDGPTDAAIEEPTSLQSVSERIEALGSDAPPAAAGGLFRSARRRFLGDPEPEETTPSEPDPAPETETPEPAAPEAATPEPAAPEAATPEPAAAEAATPEAAEADSWMPEADGDDASADDAGDAMAGAAGAAGVVGGVGAAAAVGAVGFGDQETEEFDELEQIVDEVETSDADTTADAEAEVAEDSPAPENAAELDDLFDTMVTDSEARHKQLDWASKLDDVALGAVIASSLDDGYSLIDLHSLGQSHQARFEHPSSRERLIVEIDSLGPSSSGGALLGHHAYVTVGLGKPVSGDDFDSDDIGFETPGTITIETDLESGYAYSTVDLIWEFDELVGADNSLDTSAVNRRISAALHALRGHWTERFGGS